MKIRQMEALRAVVQTGTTKEAGAAISLTQSAVSKLIGQLEDELSVQLFTRRSGRMVLTLEGRMIYDEVERVLAIVDELRAKSRDTGALRFGKLRVGTMPALAHGLLPMVLANLQRTYPNLTTVVEEQTRARIEDQVGSGYFDLGLVTLPVQDDRLELTPLGMVHAVCVLPPDHRLAKNPEISVGDLEDESVISVAPETLLRHRTDALFGEARVRRNLAFQTQSTLLACQLARNGLGVAIVHPLIAMSLSPLIVHRPFRPRIELQYAIATTRDNKSEVVRKFVALAQTEMETLSTELNARG